MAERTGQDRLRGGRKRRGGFPLRFRKPFSGLTSDYIVSIEREILRLFYAISG